MTSNLVVPACAIAGRATELSEVQTAKTPRGTNSDNLRGV